MSLLVRMVARFLRFAGALTALAALAALLAGVPWGLVMFIGWPLPDHLPTGDEIEAALLNPLSVTVLLDVLACIAWPVWLVFALDVARCVPDAVRGVRPPAIGPVHALAGLLVAAAMFGLLPPRAPVATAGPVAPVQPAASVTAEHLAPVSAVDLRAVANQGQQTQSAPGPGTVVVQSPHTGVYDSLWRIASRELGDGHRWPELFDLNQGRPQADGDTLTDPHFVRPGWVLELPDAGEKHASPSPQQPPPSSVVPSPTVPARPPSEAIPGLDSWREVENQLTSHRCPTCAPAFPNMKWMLDEKSKIVPFEDPTEAAPFEIAMKARPSPLVTQVCIDDGGAVRLKLAINPQTLLHRAAAKLLGDDATSATLQWRLVTDYVAPPKIAFPGFALRNNDADPRSSNPPHFKFTLRPEQQRSLFWMVQQEREDVAPFIEEEVEEASIPLLGWRAEGRASKEKIIRGGVLADQVGYGKTVTTLGLIDTQRSSDAKSSKEEVHGLIPIKATLILVPSQLPDQWFSEVKKFLPHSYNLMVLKSLASVDKYSVDDFQQADIIIALAYQADCALAGALSGSSRTPAN